MYWWVGQSEARAQKVKTQLQRGIGSVMAGQSPVTTGAERRKPPSLPLEAEGKQERPGMSEGDRVLTLSAERVHREEEKVAG